MAWSDAATEMKGKDKPAKKVSHVEVKHAANGGHIITHHHTAPEHHAPEDHTTKGDAAMMAHMQQAMPDQAPAADPTGAGGDPAAAAMGGGAGPNPATGAAPMQPGM
jgi:septal ring-binding cell division protein DamX